MVLRRLWVGVTFFYSFITLVVSRSYYYNYVTSSQVAKCNCLPLILIVVSPSTAYGSNVVLAHALFCGGMTACGDDMVKTGRFSLCYFATTKVKFFIIIVLSVYFALSFALVANHCHNVRITVRWEFSSWIHDLIFWFLLQVIQVM